MKNAILMCGLLAVILFSTSCNDDNLSLVTELDCAYLKAKGGTEWTYAGGGLNYTSTIVGDTTYNGATLLIGSNDINPSQKSYIGCLPNGFVIAAPDATTTQGTNVGLVVLEMDFSNPVGMEWDGPVITVDQGGIVTTNTYRLSVQETGLNMNVGGTDYSDVVKVRMRIITTSSFLPGENEFARSEYFLAPEVGLIRSTTLLMDLNGDWVVSPNSTVDLQSYSY